MLTSSKNRRKFLKSVGAISSGLVAGCLGQQGQQNGETAGSPTTAGVNLPSEDSEDYAEEWRKVASQKAKQELEGHDKLVIATDPNDVAAPGFHKVTDQRSFSGFYEVFNDNIDLIGAANTQAGPKYRRELSAGKKTTYDVLMTGTGLLLARGVPLADLTHIPSYKALPREAKAPPHQLGVNMQAGGLAYNPTKVDAPSYESLLTDQYPGEEILAAVDTNLVASGAMMQTLGEEYFTKLREKGITVLKDAWGFLVEMGQGNGSVAFGAILQLALANKQQGLDIELVRDPKAWWWGPYLWGASANPHHPWARDLWVDYWAHPDHQEVQAWEPGVYSLYMDQYRPDWLSETFSQDRVVTLEELPWSRGEIQSQWLEWLGAQQGQ